MACSHHLQPAGHCVRPPVSLLARFYWEALPDGTRDLRERPLLAWRTLRGAEGRGDIVSLPVGLHGSALRGRSACPSFPFSTRLVDAFLNPLPLPHHLVPCLSRLWWTYAIPIHASRGCHAVAPRAVTCAAAQMVKNVGACRMPVMGSTAQVKHPKGKSKVALVAKYNLLSLS